MAPISKLNLLKNYDKLVAKYGSQRALCSALGVPRSTLQDWLTDSKTLKAVQPKVQLSAKLNRGKTTRFILTSAQDNTPVHQGFLDNLLAYAKYLDADLLVSGFTYNKRLFESNAPSSSHFDAAVESYLTNRQYAIGRDLFFCAEMNTLPTAVEPLSGFEVYTGRKWGIFPHAKIQLRSIPTMKSAPAKIIMTTGAVTVSNYVQKRAGIRAHFHHALGAVLVEIDKDGDHFCRHLIGEQDTGNFQDLNNKVSEGYVSCGWRVEAITWGDIHTASMDETVADVSFGPNSNSILEELSPRYQFIHDVLDFKYRNHHNIGDPHFRFKMHVNNTDSIFAELEDVGDLLERVERSYSKTIVVQSNHDKALDKWLKTTDWRTDPANAEFYLEANLACLRAIRKGEKHSPLKWALQEAGGYALPDTTFLFEDDSFTICNGSIECGMHGHLGPNGAKGSPKQFTQMGPKANTAHTHSANITDGIYTAGTTSKLDMGYNSGLSSWTHSHIVTYGNGKRAIVTLQNGKWRG